MSEANHIGWRGQVLRKLRRWSIFLSLLISVLSIVNFYLLWQVRVLNQERATQTVPMLVGILEDMKTMNEKAMSVIKTANDSMRQSSEEIFKDTLAGLIADNYIDKHYTVNYFDVLKIIECSMKNVKPPFVYQDLLTLAWKESDFDPKSIGTHGERGVWQILAWKHYLKILGASNAFDIDTNCKMSMIELQEKYADRKTLKGAIIAYNGWVIKDGEVNQVYYKDFERRKKVIEKWCKLAEQRSKRYWK